MLFREFEQAEAQLEQTATRIASAGTSSADGAGVDTVDLSAEMIALTVAKQQASLNLQTLKTADEIGRSVIDIMA